MKANDTDEGDLDIANDLIPRNLTVSSEDLNCQNDMTFIQMDDDLGRKLIHY